MFAAAIVSTGVDAQDSHGFYVVEVASGSADKYVEANSESTTAWKVSRRFREFDALSSALRSHASCANLPLLPPKTFFNSSDVIAARRPQLDAFLSAICKMPALLSHGCVRAFLNLKVQPGGNVRHLNIEHIAVWVHPTPSPAVARLLLVHGLGEHSGCYVNHLIPALLAINVEVVRFDLRGHGSSHGERMYVDDFKDYVDDGDVVWNWTLQELPPLPSYIMGHSMGGCISTYLASRIINGGLGMSAQTDPKSLKGLILSAPAFEIGAAVSQVKIAAGRMINLMSPHTQLAGGIDRSTLSRAPGVAEAFVADPLCCEFNTVRQGTEILDAMKTMSVSAQKITCPVVIIHGEGDTIIPISGSQRLLEILTTTNKKLVSIPGALHNVHAELEDAQKLEISEITEFIRTTSA